MNSPRLIVSILIFCACACFSNLFALDESDVNGPDRFCRLNETQDLWSGPSKNFKKVREVQEGQLLKIIGEKGEYYRVLVPDGFQCYIAADYVELDDNNVGTVIGSRVNLRSIPGVKGDYPIFQIDRGEKLYVWERVGEWYCITAPEEAYLYVHRDAVSMVEDSAEVQREYETLHNRRMALWESHLGLIHQKRVAEEQADENGKALMLLEKDASTGFKQTDLDQTYARYQELAMTTEDENVRQIAQARMAEIEALKARKNLENELALREAEWRKERAELIDSGRPFVKVTKPTPETHKSPGEGRQVTVIGTVDAQGSLITLRGGKTAVDTLYRVESPDGRYILGDFHHKRVSILGRIGDLVTRDQLPLVVVERLEILN